MKTLLKVSKRAPPSFAGANIRHLLRFKSPHLQFNYFYNICIIIAWVDCDIFNNKLILQCSPHFLFALNGFEQCFKVSFSKGFSSFSLNNLEKHGWPVQNRFGKQL